MSFLYLSRTCSRPCYYTLQCMHVMHLRSEAETMTKLGPDDLRASEPCEPCEPWKKQSFMKLQNHEKCFPVSSL